MYYDYSRYPEELIKLLENLDDQQFVEKNKFDILKERLLQSYDLCPDCGGNGGRNVSCYHNDVEWVECDRCKGSKKYFDKGLMKYFGYFK